MINVTIATSAARKSVIAEPTDVIADVISKSGISVGNANVHLDGERVDTSATFADYGVADEEPCTLSAIIKADSAR